MSKQVSITQLKELAPLDGLKEENLSALVKKTQVQQVSAGTVLFTVGETKKTTYYLLNGNITLETDRGIVGRIEAGSPTARNPLSPQLPRQFTAKAETDISYISLDSDLLDVMLTWDQTGTYEVSALGQQQSNAQDDWMTTLLRTKAFHKIPPANIQAIFMRLQQVNARAGDVIIRQGEEGDYFYIITRGSCVVTRETPLNKDGIRLAELVVGDTFGEEALISEAKRNATVCMRTDGSLMRLGKDDFQKLLNEPMLDWIDDGETEQILAAGGVWLDVRLPSEFEAYHKDDAVNVPLYFIRLKLKTLDRNVPYIVCCDTGRRSSAAAFILNERGFRTYVLRGGLNQMGLQAVSTG